MNRIARSSLGELGPFLYYSGNLHFVKFLRGVWIYLLLQERKLITQYQLHRLQVAMDVDMRSGRSRNVVVTWVGWTVIFLTVGGNTCLESERDDDSAWTDIEFRLRLRWLRLYPAEYSRCGSDITQTPRMLDTGSMTATLTDWTDFDPNDSDSGQMLGTSGEFNSGIGRRTA
jgi:hypothetical protein